MIVDGVRIAEAVERRLVATEGARAMPLRLAILTCAPNVATQKFLALKRARALSLGVALEVITCPEESTTDAARAQVAAACDISDGVIIQLPFPQHIDVAALLAVLPASHDVDAIGSEAERLLAENKPIVLPPVVGAIAAIAEAHDISFTGKRVVVVGEGRLVGKPAATWCRHQGAEVVVVTKATTDLSAHTRTADMLILGAGVPGLVTPEMIRDGVLIFDAGTSEDAGKLVGDADPACAEKAALFTPVPGGIGPITISMIFHNLDILAVQTYPLVA